MTFAEGATEHTKGKPERWRVSPIYRRNSGCVLPPVSAEFSAKLDSDFGARLNKAVLVKTRLQALATMVRS